MKKKIIAYFFAQPEEDYDQTQQDITKKIFELTTKSGEKSTQLINPSPKPTFSHRTGQKFNQVPEPDPLRKKFKVTVDVKKEF